MTNTNYNSPPSMIRLIVVTVVIAVIGGILLIGIPGALILELIALIYTALSINPPELTGDSVWPIAIMISLLWPIWLTPLSLFLYRKSPNLSPIYRWLFSLFGSLFLTVLITALLLLA